MARRENPSGGNHFEQTMSECDFTELALACLCAGFIRVGIVEAGSLSWRMAAHCSWKWKAAVLILPRQDRGLRGQMCAIEGVPGIKTAGRW
jgi:hypothetical protein